MAQTLELISDILKEQYLPALRNQITTEPSPFLQMIKKRPLTAGKVVAATPFGINGGFGFGSEAGATPTAAEQQYRRFEIDPVDMFVDIRLTDKVIKLGTNEGAVINALDEEVAGAYKAAKWNIGRALFGDGSGIIAKITKAVEMIGTSTSKSWLYLDTVANVVEGLMINCYYYTSASSTNATKMSSLYRVNAVDHVNKRIQVNGLPEVVTASTNDNSETGAGFYGYITVQGSKGKELTGLGAIFNQKISTLYGLSKADNAWIVPIEVDAANTIDDIVIYDAVKQAEDHCNTHINLLMMGDNAFRAFRNYMRTHQVALVDRPEYIGGVSGFKVAVGNGIVTVLNEKMVPENEAWGVDTETFQLQMSDLDFCNLGGNGVFQLVPGTSQYHALLSAYGNLICSNPGGCVRIINCNEA